MMTMARMLVIAGLLMWPIAALAQETALDKAMRKDPERFAGQVGDLIAGFGGPDGLAKTLRDKAKMTLAFGAATWPHQLVRIMLLEQIYRAVTILGGHPYHRA